MSSEIGARLQQARQAKNLTIEQVARATRLRPHHIQAIEEGRLEALPSPVHARAFLRIYAEHLGLSLEELTALVKDNDVLLPSLATTSQPPDQPIQQTGPQAKKAIPAPASRRRAPATIAEPPPASQETSPPLPPVGEERVSSEETSFVPDARALFRSIGETLRQQREVISLTLEEVAEQTHLRPPLLQALEEGNIDALPSPVQARGMLNTYAHFLGLDTESLLLRFAEGLQRRHQERLAAASTARPKRPRARRLPAFATGDLVGGAFLFLFLIGTVIWGVGQVNRRNQHAAPTATLPSISEVLLSTPIATESSAAIPTSTELPLTENNEANSTALETVAVEGKVQVVLVALQRVWVRVAVDGRVVQEGRLLPGQAYPFGGEERIEVLTGNAAAIQILYNQQELGVLGSLGEVVNVVFTAGGIQTPTPTVTPTPTASPSPTSTPRPSPTPRPSATPRP